MRSRNYLMRRFNLGARADRLPREIVEACLVHASGDAVELACRRTDFLDKRRKLIEAWRVLRLLRVD